jgi:hypothetical protein
VADPALVESVKKIVALLKSGKPDEGHLAYAALFASPEFSQYPANDQRQTLKFMILAKGIPTFPSAAILDAHKKAISPLKTLLAAEDDPADYELLGLCYMRLEDEKNARATFQKGLDLERARNPQSPLCGQLMKWVAAV